jgi:molybdate transport system substrate-binding protein
VAFGKRCIYSFISKPFETGLMSALLLRRLARPAAMLAALLASLPSLAAELTVSAAASLTNAFKDLAPLFESANPGHKLQFNFAASGALLQQIAKGAPVDVFASADQETMDQAQAQKLVDVALRRNFAANTLVVIVPAASGNVPKALPDLALAGFQRIAIGRPASVPVGRYTKGALESARVWNQIQRSMVSAHSVRQVLDYVARGEVDAGFVYATDAMLMPDKVKVALTVPTATPIVYPAAPVAASAQPALARSFVEFLLTPPAQAVLAKHGFGHP